MTSEIDSTEARLADAQQKRADWITKIADAATAARKAQVESEKYSFCAGAARQWVQVPQFGSADSQDKLDDVVLLCHTG
ncbi:hypothetical protein [Kibdelosporangium phytohabitans]|uniref:Uncharacterized protein n=1 Tax=Kibdelosporangium phytohabitans TaxID=860235 RepID=A0A0N9I1L3_9PSEU|nr:hypothetical protein [Kibdelosporangium phytohabitans]ALG09729.1 hypothetical protein AOZ06_25025 [Kibdelosporangium phytohabitans]MBE1468907.1 hypothetical protein [Kibdelosporangium phytohabitans]